MTGVQTCALPIYLRARMTDLRQAGLKVRREKNTEGRARYAISARDEAGSRAKIFA